MTKEGNPVYYKNLFRNTKNFFFGMKKEDLINELDILIRDKLEKRMGANIQQILLVYKNLPYMNSFTCAKHGDDVDYVYKFTIEKWLDEIEKWIMQKVIELEPLIRFSSPVKQFV